jgi:hypothetical protein
LDAGIADARDPQTIGWQQEPTHHWEIHPLIDGCGIYPRLHILPVKGPVDGQIIK